MLAYNNQCKIFMKIFLTNKVYVQQRIVERSLLQQYRYIFSPKSMYPTFRYKNIFILFLFKNNSFGPQTLTLTATIREYQKAVGRYFTKVTLQQNTIGKCLTNT